MKLKFFKTFSLLFFACSFAFGASPSTFVLDIYEASKLSYEKSLSEQDVFSSRKNESFVKVPVSREQEDIIRKTVSDAMAFLPAKYWPSKLTISLENKAIVSWSDGLVELLPMSLATSEQNPPRSAIRFGTFELNGNLAALQSIIAHEVGHSMIEWACRQAGVTAPNQFTISHWSKPIYEGVADFIAASVTHSTLIAPGTWVERDILEYPTLIESKNPKRSTSEILALAYGKLGLVPQYRSYNRFLDFVNQFTAKTGIKDPYSEGTWVAGSLWKLSNSGQNSRGIFRIILQLAVSGKEFQNSEDFVHAVTEIFLRAQRPTNAVR